jgi:TPR repeat protein
MDRREKNEQDVARERQDEQDERNHDAAQQETNAHVLTTQNIEDNLECPISHEIMQDPVIIVQTGHTYDRQTLCQWLEKCPTRCPLTNQVYDEKLWFNDNITARKLLTMYKGDAAYQPFDDSDFLEKHDARLIEPSASTLFKLGKRRYTNIPDDDRARLYFELAAKENHSGAQYALGSLYVNGHGVEQDFSKAKEYYHLAAEQGHVDAQWALGIIYSYNAEGVKQDFAKSRSYLEQAAAQNHADAQCSLGSLYVNGHGVKQDFSKAKEYYHLAAEQGHANAQFFLGSFYRDGLGVEQDLEKAKNYFEKAANQGFEHAQKALASLEI